MESGDFWNDNQKAQTLISELKAIKALIGELPGYEQQCKDLLELLEMYEADKEEAAAEQVAAEARKLGDEVRKYELRCQLTGKNDHRNAFVSFQEIGRAHV